MRELLIIVDSQGTERLNREILCAFYLFCPQSCKMIQYHNQDFDIDTNKLENISITVSPFFYGHTHLSPSSPSSLVALIYSQFLDFYISKCSINGVTLWMSFFTQHYSLKTHASGCLYQKLAVIAA